MTDSILKLKLTKTKHKMNSASFNISVAVPASWGSNAKFLRLRFHFRNVFSHGLSLHKFHSTNIMCKS